MSRYRFNAIVILDAIPEGDLNTARSLRDDLEAIASFSGNGLRVCYFRLETRACLQRAFNEICRLRKCSDLEPLLHVEAHGLINQDGFALPQGQCSWTELKEVLTPLNADMGLNLMFVMAACFGGAFARAIRTTDRAPVYGLIGPTEQIQAGILQGDFVTFYKILFDTLSVDRAIEALNPPGQKVRYFCTSAERFFYGVWRAYKRSECSEKKLSERADRICRELKSNGIYRRTEEVVGEIKDKEREFFSRYRKTYFMLDLYPDNERRFAITYEKAEAFSQIAE